MKKRNKIIISILIIIVLFISGSMVFIYNVLNNIDTVKIDKSEFQTTDKKDSPVIAKKEEEDVHKVRNILLLGVDNQENASDTNMILTIDDSEKKIKLTSLMRDTYVDLGEGRPITKLNYAYHYGGPTLSVKTVNDIFKMDIEDYVKINFDGLVNIIDYIGGITIDINDAEANAINGYGKNIAKITNKKYTPISGAGVQHLNGQQATAYCRFRYDENNDYGRTERQRKVLTKIIEKVEDYNVTEYPDIISNVLSYVETTLSKTELIEIGVKCSLYMKNGISQSRCPYDGLLHNAMIDGIYYMKWDEAENIEKLHNFIYLE